MVLPVLNRGAAGRLPSALARRRGQALRRTLVALAAVAALGCAGDAPAEGGAAPPAGDAPAAGASSRAGRPELRELLREDLGAAPDERDGGGRAWLERMEPERVRAGGRARFTIVYEAGPLGIADGGTILLQVSPFWGWSTPQVENPMMPGYTTVELVPAAATAAAATTAASGAAPPAGAPALRPATLDRQLLGIHVEGGELREGDRVRIVYGASDALAAVDRFAERATRLWIGVDGDGDGRRALVDDSPTVDIAPGPPALLVAHLPSAAEPGATVPLVLALLDASGNRAPGFDGAIRLSTENEGVELPAELRFPTGGGAALRTELRVGSTDVVRVRAEGPGGLEAWSNPLVVSPGAQRILWADLHGHSHFSDGTGTPEDYFRYARDTAALDVAALTDHDHWGLVPLAKSPAMWDEIRAQVERFHQPGRFVTLLGYEWTNWISGHRHVLYFGENAAEQEILSSLDPRYETPALLWEALAGRDALTFAHHSAGGPIATDWSIPPDPELEPITEVVSVHGSSEAPDSPIPIYAPIAGNFVRDALDRGYRLGFVGSGDSHDGHPGLAHVASPSGGMAAILADELSREAVLQALRERRAYATNGPRIVLRVALDGARMGSSLPAGRRHRLQVVVAGTGPLERVDLVSSGGGVETVDARGRTFWTLERDVGPIATGGWLYVRAVQEDGGAAWSSPFFFE